MKARLILVGGFLGSGKTTLMYEAARRLTEGGRTVGLITNDQASQLVDTAFLSTVSGTVREVSGSCFCCNFDGFVEAVDSISGRNGGGIILAEPVGSCTDLSATILQPLKVRYSGDMDISPLTVLADPQRLDDILGGGTSGVHKSAAYIIQKQFEEADILLINKSDLLAPDELARLKARAEGSFPNATVLCASAKTGEGIGEWLSQVLTRADSGRHIAQVDYDTYAEGEAVLGWLNASIALAGSAADWDDFAARLIRTLSERFDRAEAAVGHVKLMLRAGDQYLLANVTGKRPTLALRGHAGSGDSAALTLNARVEMSPEALELAVRETLPEVCGSAITFEIQEMTCLKPGRPNPTYRYGHIVN